MTSTHHLNRKSARRPGGKWLLRAAASILIVCLAAGPVSASAAENDINEYLLSDIGLTYAEISGKYGEKTNISGFEGELFAEFAHNTYSFRPGGMYDAAYSGAAPFDVIPKDDAVCYAVDTTAGALFPWLDGSCTVSELAARGFSASAVSSRTAAFAGVVDGDFCHFVYGDCVIDIALDGSGAAGSFSKDSDAFITGISFTAAGVGSGEGQNELFGEWTKMSSDYPYENLTKFCLYPDYTFKATVNLMDRMGFMSGAYSIDGDTARCTVLFNDFAGYTGADTEQFELLYSDGTMLYMGAYMGDLFSSDGPVVLERIRTYLNVPAGTSPEGGEPSAPGPFEPYTLALHYGCPIYDQPSSKAGTVTAYIDYSTLYTVAEEATDEYGVTWGALKSGAGWICLPPSGAAEEPAPSGEAEAERAYMQILDEYKRACEEGDYDESLPLRYPNVNETLIGYYYIYSGSGFYTSYRDINADGVDELFIGCGTDDYVSIADLYLFDGTKAVKAIDDDTLGDRSRLTLFANGTLFEQGSSGAASGIVALYKVNDTGTGLDKICAYDYLYDESGNCRYYDEYGASISEDEFYALLDEQTGGQAAAAPLDWELLAGPFGG